MNLGSRPDLDTEFLDAPEPIELGDAIEDFGLELAIRRIIDMWADRSLGEMLDYVYFHTEPMEGAERGKTLDFSKVEPQPEPQSISVARPVLNKAKAIERVRKSISEMKAAQPPPPRLNFTPPSYDDDYFEALRIMEEDNDY